MMMETHNDGAQHGDEGAEAPALLDQRLPDGLLLRLLQQQILVTHILHGAVQLRLDVPATWVQETASIAMVIT